MQEFLKVNGIVIGVFPQGEYDRRITLLTRERGKITAFVKSARRQGSRFLGTTDMFAYGTFELYVGRTSYNVQNAEISNYFEFLRTDLDAAYMAMYFLELADYYAVENNDESMLILLLYRALQGLKSMKLKNDFVRRVYEVKLFSIEGELIPPESLGKFSNKLLNVVRHINESSIEKLFNFEPEKEVYEELKALADIERKKLVDKKLKSLDLLETMIS